MEEEKKELTLEDMQKMVLDVTTAAAALQQSNNDLSVKLVKANDEAERLRKDNYELFQRVASTLNKPAHMYETPPEPSNEPDPTLGEDFYNETMAKLAGELYGEVNH